MNIASKETSDLKVQNVENISQKDLKSEPKTLLSLERLWSILFGILIVLFVKIFLSFDDFHADLDRRGISHGSLGDLKISVVSACVFYIIKNIWERSTVSFIIPLIDEKHEGKERAYRAQRVSKWLCDFLYYTSTTIFSIIYFRSILPTSMLGDQKCDQIFADYPYPLAVLWAKEFYLVQMGAHLHKIVDQVIRKRNDVKFWEYFLHHFLTFSLMLSSYLANRTRVGLLILIIHDFTDIFLSLTRAMDALKYKIPILFPLLFITTFFVWTYCRGIVYPLCQVQTVFIHCSRHVYEYNEKMFIEVFFDIQLAFLVFMNFYWIKSLGEIFFKNLFGMSVKNMIKGKAYANGYDPKLLKEDSTDKVYSNNINSEE